VLRMSKTSTPGHISRDDLERKLRGLQGDIKGAVDNQRSNLIMVAGGVGLVLVLVFYLLGRRSGKNKSTIVEIRRV
jgi:hypothetical protein